MVTWLGVFAWGAVDGAGAHRAAQGLTHQNVVDAQAPVFLKAQHPVVPPRIAFFGLLEHAVGICQPQRQQGLEMCALFSGVVNGFAQTHGVVRVAVLRRHVEVTHQYQARMRCHFGAHHVLQCLQPAHLVGKLFGARLLSIHKIAIDQPQRACGGVQRGSDHAGLLVPKARNVAHHIAQRVAAQNRNAVVGFLPEGGRFIARGLERIVRKFVVGELELLQAQRVHRVGGQPLKHLGQAHRQRIHVPGGNLHGFWPLALIH